MQNKSEKKTLFMSVIMSAPGPLIIAMGLLVGQSSTQIADFVRRSAELLGIIMAYVVYVITTKDGICDSTHTLYWTGMSQVSRRYSVFCMTEESSQETKSEIG